MPNLDNIFNKFLYKLKIKEFKSKNIEKKIDRNPNSNKGDYGHVLVIAGNLGFGGAALLSSKAVLASGAGLATLATRKDHLSAALAYCPEVMSKTVESISDLENHLPNKTVICIGPGLGRNYWADQMLYKTTNFVSAIENQQGFKIACLEEIALNNKWIKKRDVTNAIKFYGNCEYSKYLKKIIS